MLYNSEKKLYYVLYMKNVDENSTMSGDSRENCPELKAVYSKDIGRPSLSGSNTARKPTLQVNEVVLRFRIRRDPRWWKKGNKGGTAYIRPLQ